MKKYIIPEIIISAVLIGCGKVYLPNLDSSTQGKTDLVQEVLPHPEVRTQLPVTPGPFVETLVATEWISTPSLTSETTAGSAERTLKTPGPTITSTTYPKDPSHSPDNPEDPLRGTNSAVLLINESFAISEGWDQFDNNYARGAIEHGHYSLTIKDEAGWSWILHGPRGASFYYQGTITVGECRTSDNYGLLFRARDDGSFMLFSVSCDGKYRLVRSIKGSNEEIIPWTTSTAINKYHYLQVAGTEDGLTMRDGPNLNTEVSHFARDYEVFRVEDGPQQSNDLTWWLITDRNNPSRSGWSASKYLRETRTNVVGVRAEGHRFNLYVNGEYITMATDDTFSGGKFGLYAASHATPGLYVAFDDIVVYPVIGRGVPLAPSPEPSFEIQP